MFHTLCSRQASTPPPPLLANTLQKGRKCSKKIENRLDLLFQQYRCKPVQKHTKKFETVSAVAVQLASFLRPKQLGVGVPGGCEAVIHAARDFVQSSHISSRP